MTQNIPLGSFLIILGVIFIALSIPLVKGRIPPNHWYGIRIPAAFRSDEAWYRINRHGGKCFFAFGAAQVIAGVVVVIALGSLPDRQLVPIVMALPLVLLVPTLLGTFAYPKAPK